MKKQRVARCILKYSLIIAGACGGWVLAGTLDNHKSAATTQPSAATELLRPIPK